MAIGLIFQSFGLALGQIGDPRFRRVLFLGVGLTLLLLIASYAGGLWLVEALTSELVDVPGVGEVGWLGDLLKWGSLFFMVILSMFLMIPVASAITSLFLDDVAQAVEDKHYPHLPQPPRISFGEGLKDSVNFLGVLVVANLLAVILYIFLAPLALFIFWGLNGFLLGREYFQLVAMRRIGRVEAKKLRSKHTGTIWAAGVLMAVPLSIPLLNLVIPILGAATFTHIYHNLSDR